MIFSSELVATAAVSFLLGWTLKRGRLLHLLKSSLNQKNQSDNIKLVLVVRPDLKMSAGKIASQCSHATLACYKEALNVCPDKIKLWESVGQAKVVVRSNPGAESLRELAEKAVKAGLVVAVIRDAGRTQVPTGSPTVLGIGPDCARKVDEVTSGLKLL